MFIDGLILFGKSNNLHRLQIELPFEIIFIQYTFSPQIKN